MDRVATATGAAAALSDIGRKLSSSERFLKPYHVVLGPSDSGKTRFCEGLRDDFSESYYAVHLEGDRSNPQCQFLPFGRILLDAKAHEHARSHVSESVGSVPTVGGTLKFLFSLLNLKEHAQRQQTLYLSEIQRQILYALQSNAGRRDALVICDALEAWDIASLDLLSLVRNPQVIEAFPVLARTFFVFVLRDDAASNDAIFNLVRGAGVARLRRMDFESFEQFMADERIPVDVPRDVLRELHRICDGAISVSKMISVTLRRGGYRRAVSESDIKSLVLQHVMRTLEDRRDADDLRNFLRAASAIGVRFTRSELQCLVGECASEQLTVAEELSFVRKIDDDGYGFSSEMLIEVFGPGDYAHAETHAAFAECLRVLRPDDYASRAAHLEKAGRQEAAAVMRSLAALKSLRDGRLEMHATSDAAPLRDEARILARGDELIQNGRYPEAIQLLEGLDPTAPRELLFERDILLARAKIKTLDLPAQQEAIELLKCWSSEYRFEFEIWQRAMLLLVVALGFVGRLEEALTEYKRLHQHLLHHSSPSTGATVLHRLELKRDIFLPPNVSATRIENAVSYFGPSSAGTAARDPMNYYIGLSNLVASFVVRGEFGKAVETARTATSFLSALPGTLDEFKVPRPDVLANNTTIAYLSAGLMSPDAAWDAMMKLLESASAGNDRPLLLSNAAALAIASGKPSEAAKLIEEARAYVESDRIDPFYRYFVFNNAAMHALTQEDHVEARALWRRAPQGRTAAPTLAEWLDRRDQIIGGNLSGAQIVTLAELQMRLDGSAPDEAPGFPAPWRHLGKALLLSDLQFWSDD